MAAKKNAEPSAETAVEPAKTGGGALVAYDYGQDAKLGFDSMTAADIAVPFINVLQALSPEVGQDPNEKVKGAEVGDLLNSISKRVYKGNEGVVFIPCERVRAFVEWVPRAQGGGLVGMHDAESPVVAKAKEKNGGSNIGLKSEKGNDLIETIYVYGLVLEDENATEADGFACIAFTSTKIKHWRDMVYSLQSVKGLKAPLFAHRVRITTFADKNAKGAFANLRLRPIAWKEGQVTDADIMASLVPPTVDGKPSRLLEQGKKLLTMVRGGTAKADMKSQKKEGEQSGDEVF